MSNYADDAEQDTLDRLIELRDTIEAARRELFERIKNRPTPKPDTFTIVYYAPNAADRHTMLNVNINNLANTLILAIGESNVISVERVKACG